MNDFDQLRLPQALNEALKDLNFTTPTPIQAQAIPPALEGRDILGTAQTGTGKTVAFGVPLITSLLANSRSIALVLTPTRELAMQVNEALRDLTRKCPLKSALLIGGDSLPKQVTLLRSRPRIIVGTPGRINDHLERGTLMLHNVNFLVLDETDRMLDMGFSIQLDQIAKFLIGKRQTLMFSATLPKEILKVAAKYLNNPARISVGSITSPVEKIDQQTVQVRDDEKYACLVDELHQREGSIIVFARTKHGAEKLTQKLAKQRMSVDALHGDLRQNQRKQVIAGFRDSRYRILVATDIAARGLDIPHVEHVINYDLPQVAEDYIHRIGRTARAGAEGAALSILTPGDRMQWNAICKLLDPERKQDGGANHAQAARRQRRRGRSRNANRHAA